MKHSIPVLIGVVALVLLGAYELLQTPGALAGESSPFLGLAFAAKAILCLVAAVALWMGAGWGPVALVVLGLTYAALFLIEGIVLGIRPWLFAAALALAWIAAGFVAAMLVRRGARRS